MPDDRPEFADVCAAERDEIAERRRALHLPPPRGAAGSFPADLVGLALSGGGIRSATFSLGVLQALAEHRLLRLVDYLSTVSGGGFIGSCVSSLLNDPGTSPDASPDLADGTAPFPLRWRSGRADTPAVRHLRNSENYLAPGGFADRMRIPALMLRGVLLNVLFLVPYLLLAVGATGLVLNWEVAAGYGGLLFTILPLVAPAMFLLLVVTYPIVARRVSRGGWEVRNAYEGAVTFWFLAAIGSALLWPLFGLVEGALRLTPSDLAASVERIVGGTQWLAVLAVIAAVVAACALVPRIAAAARKLALLAAGAAPLLVIGAYLLLCVFLLEPPGPGANAVSPSLLILGFAWLAFNVVFFNVNLTSAHGFYRDRLSRAYLIRRQPAGESVVPVDRQKLTDLNGRGTTAPYHLINVSLDLNGTTDVNVRGRDCAFFAFSKHFTGGTHTGYCRTSDLEAADPHMDLATAAAISGAAASPNAGAVTVPQLVPLMTLLNVRLDYWLPNPTRIGRDGMGRLWSRLRHRLGPGPSYLWREALGRVDSRGAFVNVSDGGHIENLAIYELLRRRCRLIIAVDGEQDPDMRFDGLLKLVLYARIDLGVNVDVALGPLRLNDARVSDLHCVPARIDYGDGEDGWLLYLKASMTGDEDETMRDYRRTHPEFPHEPTSDQFFDERQFEMYRALGFHVGEHAVEQIIAAGPMAPGLSAIRHFLAHEMLWSGAASV